MKISGCIIARNEESNIAQCISSLKEVTDEIILVDTGSDDKTIQLAEGLGAFVYEYKWDNDFSKAKNEGLKHAKGDWIIFLDADEYFHEDSLPRVRSVIDTIQSDYKIDGVLCEIVHIDKDSKRLISTDEILRIFRNNEKFRFVNKIHEEIRNNGTPLNCINMRDKLSIIHTGYSDSLHEEKARRNLELLLNNTDDEKSAYYLAATYYILRDYNNAFEYAELALTVDTIENRDTLAYKMHLIKISAAIKTDFDNKIKITKLINDANQKYGCHPEIAKIEATYLMMEKIYGKALDKFQYALYCHDNYGKAFAQNDFAGSAHEVYFNIGYILYLMNKEADALSYYVMALNCNKYYSSAFNAMFSLFETVPEQEVITFINSIYDINNKTDLEFVIARVADCGRNKIVLYYADKWNNNFAQEDDVLIYAFISQEKYLSALEIALFYLNIDAEQYSSIATCVILLGNLFSEAEKVKGSIQADYFEIIISYAEGRKYSGNVDAFLSVFSKLNKYVNHNEIEDYLIIGADLGVSAIEKIADIYLSNNQYNEAIVYFNNLFELEDEKERKAAAAFKSGYCYYKLKQYKKSVRWFQQAAVNGYQENDLKEYLKWIEAQDTDHAV